MRLQLQPVNHSVSQSASQPVSHSATQPLSHSASQPLSQSVSAGWFRETAKIKTRPLLLVQDQTIAKMQSAGDKNNLELFRLYKAWVVSKQMCADRGYLVTKEMTEMPFDQWNDLYGERIGHLEGRRELSYFARKESGDFHDQLLVYFPNDPDVSTSLIKSIHAKLQQEGASRAIIVYKGKLSNTVRKVITPLRELDFFFEFFTEAEMAVNVTRHRLVPKHEVLSEAEKQALLQRYSITADKLPVMQDTDPVARYLGLGEGQVVRIVRASETAGRYITYRIVRRII
eukprot:gene2309-5294_t